MTSITERIAEKLTEARKEAGLTQKQIAEKLGISEGQYLHYEKCRAEPSMKLLHDMCQLFEESADDWLNLQKKPDKPEWSQAERNRAAKFRELDWHGREVVDLVLEKEHERIYKGISLPVAARGGGGGKLTVYQEFDPSNVKSEEDI